MRSRAAIHLQELLLGLDVDAPVAEAIGEADIEPLLADRDGKLAVGDDGQGEVLGLVEDVDVLDLGRREGVADEPLGVDLVLEDVDLLALELADDRLDAYPFEADAGAHGIDILAVGIDRDLRPVTGFAHDLEDVDGLVVDLGDLELKYLPHELGMSPREDDERTHPPFLHLDDHSLDAVVGVVSLARRLVLLGEKAFDLPEVDEDVPVLLALVVPDDDLADLRLVLGVLGVSGYLAKGLARRLLREHDRLKVELVRIDGQLEDVAHFGAVRHFLGLFERDLQDGVVDFLDDGLLRVDIHALVIVLEPDDGVLVGTVLLLICGHQGIFDRLDDEVLGYALLVDELPYRFCHFGSHMT